jgi:hypothetical protein
LNNFEIVLAAKKGETKFTIRDKRKTSTESGKLLLIRKNSKNGKNFDFLRNDRQLPFALFEVRKTILNSLLKQVLFEQRIKILKFIVLQ